MYLTPCLALCQETDEAATTQALLDPTACFHKHVHRSTDHKEPRPTIRNSVQLTKAPPSDVL